MFKTRIDSLEALIVALKEVPLGDVESFSRLLEAVTFKREAIEPYCFFKDAHYTRNLVARTDTFELLVLCWKAGQVSPIHNHHSQDCWMFIVDGILEETLFHADPVPLEEDRVRLTLTKKTSQGYGHFFYINDTLGLHQVGNGGSPEAISLHLYSLPFDSCNIYCEKTGKIQVKNLSYHSIRGKLCTV
jgi:cysteine dioxygenase